MAPRRHRGRNCGSKGVSGLITLDLRVWRDRCRDDRDTDGVTHKKPVPTAEAEAARELVRLAREQGLALTGPGGLLKQLTKTVIETALNEEMTEHLGYEKDDPAGQGAGSGNVRNGTRPKQVLTGHATRLHHRVCIAGTRLTFVKVTS
jgi:hypothetical protein